MAYTYCMTTNEPNPLENDASDADHELLEDLRAGQGVPDDEPLAALLKALRDRGLSDDVQEVRKERRKRD